jgi:hypothetical protein
VRQPAPAERPTFDRKPLQGPSRKAGSRFTVTTTDLPKSTPLTVISVRDIGQSQKTLECCRDAHGLGLLGSVCFAAPNLKTTRARHPRALPMSLADPPAARPGKRTQISDPPQRWGMADAGLPGPVPLCRGACPRCTTGSSRTTSPQLWGWGESPALASTRTCPSARSPESPSGCGRSSPAAPPTSKPPRTSLSKGSSARTAANTAPGRC